MVQFFVDKSNKVPLYLQLTDEIKYYISTGVLGENDRLPPVKVLAKNLGINFLTVRKAYKELETAGLLDVRHGEGTFISLTNVGTRARQRSKKNENALQSDIRQQFADAAKELFEKHSRRGLDIADAKKIVDDAFAAIERSLAEPRVVFAECNQFQVDQISEILEKELKLGVEPILIEKIEKRIPSWMNDRREVNIVTTGFHVDEIRRAVGEMPIQIDVLITNLDPKTRRELEAVGEKGKYGFICRDEESAAVYKGLLQAELGYKRIQLSVSTLAEPAKVKSILSSSDVVLVSPKVYDEVKKISPPGRTLFNVFGRVDPMSLRVIRERILGRWSK